MPKTVTLRAKTLTLQAKTGTLRPNPQPCAAKTITLPRPNRKLAPVKP
jgi:hypothetical protein